MLVPDNRYRCEVALVSQERNRPLWSVMIPTYNCAHYLGETLKSVLTQDPGQEQMEICVIDDHSTKDNPEEVVNSIGKGRVQFFRQKQNVGHIENFATCLNLSKGQLIHLLHGDDKVKNGFYSRMQSLFKETPELGAAFCRNNFINEEGTTKHSSELAQEHSGVLHNWLRRMAEVQMVQTPAMVVRRSVYEQLGGFDKRLKYCEDWEMWVRIAAKYPIGYEPTTLAEYRVHTSSITSRTAMAAQNVRDLKRCIDIIYQYLEKSERNAIRRKSLNKYAWYTLSLADTLYSIDRDKNGAKSQLHEALLLEKSPGFLLEWTKLYSRILFS